MYFPQKPEILKERGGSRFWNSKGMGGGGVGVTQFGISEGKGGLKHGSRSLLGMDIFWNCPLKPAGESCVNKQSICWVACL